MEWFSLWNGRNFLAWIWTDTKLAKAIPWSKVGHVTNEYGENMGTMSVFGRPDESPWHWYLFRDRAGFVISWAWTQAYVARDLAIGRRAEVYDVSGDSVSGFGCVC